MHEQQHPLRPGRSRGSSSSSGSSRRSFCRAVVQWWYWYKRTLCDAAVLTVVVGVPQGTSGPDPTTVFVDMRALRHDR